jgi:CHAD domain-containing protein
MATKPEPVNAAAALSALEHGMRAYKAFENAHLAIAALAGLEQLTAERQRAADGALRDLEVCRQELTKAGEDLNAAKQEAKDIRAKAKSQAGDIVSKANADATVIVGEAQLAADSHKAAQATAQSAQASLSAEVEALRAELTATNERIAEAKKAARALLEG